jgi:hypothetical protein
MSLLAGCRDTVRANHPVQHSFRHGFADTHMPPGRQWADAIRRRRTELLANGDIVWGYVIQTRTGPFAHGGVYDMLGDVIYCTDEHAQAGPTTLEFAADAVLRLKSRDPLNAAEEILAKHLKAAVSRAYGLIVPDTCCADYCAEISSVLITPSDLPDGALSLAYFPIAVLLDGTAMPVPGRYWPPEFRMRWKSQQ